MAQVAVVTGGSAGIGLATAEVLARRGWSVAILARDEHRLAGTSALAAAQVRSGALNPNRRTGHAAAKTGI